jgi:large subunit ribosomal protein L24
MKKQYSKFWKASKQGRKQRKYVAQAPQHVKQKLLSSHLSKELRIKYGRRSFQLRKGDTVKIMNGEYKRKSGKISIVDLYKLKVAIEGLQITKKDGSKVNVSFAPSNLLITELNMDDKKRSESLKKEQVVKKEAKK